MTESKWLLIADDDPDDIEMLTDEILRQDAGVRIKSFKDGRALLDFLGSADPGMTPAAVVLDYNMPILTGFEVLQSLRVQLRFKELPIVMWSTSGMAVQVNDCFEAGATDYLAKPIAPRELERIVKIILSHCRFS